MILRKPYAFLIQYFQRIHLILLGLSFYIFYKTSALRTFVSEFIKTESYNTDLESIKSYVGFLPVIIIILCVLTFIVLMILLRHKEKPWKVYLLPLFDYIFLLIIMFYIRNYFMNYNEVSDITKIMAARDLLFIAYIPQFIIILLLIIRMLGIDLNKFGFQKDKEYLDIKEEDREEFEVNVEFDKDKIKRLFNKLIRSLKYLYYEHKFICRVLLSLFVILIIGYNYYYFGVLHRIYRENQSFNSNFYQITVKDSYITNNKDNGDLIEKDSSFVIIKLSVKNLAGERDMYIDRFRLVNRNNEGKKLPQYQPYFAGYGKVYDNATFKNNETKNFILIYRVDKNWKNRNYILYYQGLGNSLLLRKVKLKLKDYREITNGETKKINQKMTIDKKDFTITSYQIANQAVYYSYKCLSSGCGVNADTVSSYNNDILQINYISEYFDSKTFVDFSTKYARIKYEDSNGKVHTLNCTDAIGKDYTTKALYFKVPSTLKESKKIDLVYTVNGKKYTYHLKK